LLGHQTPLYGEHSRPKWVSGISRPLQTEQNKPKTLNDRFFFLWIAFNAAYATDIVEQQRLSERETFKAFLEKPCSLVATKTSRLRLVGVSRQHSRTTGQPVHPAQPSSFMVEQPGMAE